jgi:hypothetical protein
LGGCCPKQTILQNEFVCPDHISPRQRAALSIPTDELSLRGYTLGDDDLESIEAAQTGKQVGFAQQTALISGRAQSWW